MLKKMKIASLVAQTVKASAYNVGDLGSIPGLGRSPGEGNGRSEEHTSELQSSNPDSLNPRSRKILFV